MAKKRASELDHAEYGNPEPEPSGAVEQLTSSGQVKRGTEVSSPPAKQRPAHEIRIGRVKAVIWENHTEAGVRHNVTFRRLFKRDQNAQWEQSDAFGRDDLHLVALVAERAELWIYEQGGHG